MQALKILGAALLLALPLVSAAAPKLEKVDAALGEMVDEKEIAGAVTAVVSKEKVLHLGTTGFANVESKQPMAEDTVFWIASMTKPVTAVAVMMLFDEGKLKPGDLVSKYIPEFADLKTPSGKQANLTITHILTHTSGLAEATGDEARKAKTLKELVPFWLAKPTAYEPGEKWAYNQCGGPDCGSGERDELR